MLENYLKKLDAERLQDIIRNLYTVLTEEQRVELESLIHKSVQGNINEGLGTALPVRMSQEFVNEKMEEMQEWMRQIDEGELYLQTEGYEDYSEGYWDCDWVTEYYDTQGIGEKITTGIRFARECVDDKKYYEANVIYAWLWEMGIRTDEEYDDAVDLETLFNEDLIKEDVEQLALLTLYTTYQMTEASSRAEEMYSYFIYYPFKELKVEKIFFVGRENLLDEKQFWKDWIELLKTKSGETESRLLNDAILYCDGIDGLVRTAEEECVRHPSLYLTAMKEYEKKHAYAEMEHIGKGAIEKIDVKMIVRSEIALYAACASDILGNTENVMAFCFEMFRSNSTVRNFLRLFAIKEIAQLYGFRGREEIALKGKSAVADFTRNMEMRQNVIDRMQYNTLCFYMGDFKTPYHATKNPTGSLGWTGKYVREGVHLFLLYLYDQPLPSKAAKAVANQIGFSESGITIHTLSFEKVIMDESEKYQVSMFWNYFQRWKQYFPMDREEKVRYLKWLEKIIYSRADAIVSGQFRRHYGSVAILLAMLSQIKLQMGEVNADKKVFAIYKKKFPRHSSFQADMKEYFEMW